MLLFESYGKRVVNSFLSSAVILVMMALFSVAVDAAEPAVLSVGNVDVLGQRAVVSLTLQNVAKLSAGKFVLPAPTGGNVVYEGISFSPRFEGGKVSDFFSMVKVAGGELTLEFVSNDGGDHKIVSETIANVSYRINAATPKNYSFSLEPSGVSLRDKDGREVAVQTFSGSINRGYMVGDPLGRDEITSAAALRTLQHASGINPLYDQGAIEAADVDADGQVTLSDAQAILRRLVGLENSFLALKTITLPNVITGFPYVSQVEAVHGEEPYHWEKKKGQLPKGLVFDENTGKISGAATKQGTSKFSVEVTDRTGAAVEKEFELVVTDSGIVKVEAVEAITVLVGDQPNLPSKIRVTYADGSAQLLDITWGAVDTSQAGTKRVSGKVGNTGLTVATEVTVLSDQHILQVDVSYVELLNLHTIVLDVSREVFGVRINNLAMHYEGNDRFSLATTTLNNDSNVIIKAYDKFGNLIESRRQLLR